MFSRISFIKLLLDIKTHSSKKNTTIILIMTIMAILNGFVLFNNRTKPKMHLPFKCYGLTEYTLLNEKESVTFDLSQDFSIFKDGQAYLSFNGVVRSHNKKTIINRTMHLNSATFLDESTVIFNTLKINKPASDNTPDTLFNLLLNEYSYTDDDIIVNMVNIDRSTWVLGTQTSFLMTCIVY